MSTTIGGDEFQGSLAGTGIPSDRAAYLSRNLRSGGAIVTVRDTDRAAEAEQILSSNNGKVRYEDVAGTDVAEYQLQRCQCVRCQLPGRRGSRV